MLAEKKKRLQEYVIAGGGVLFISLLLVFLVQYEQARSRDGQRLGMISGLQSALQLYNLDRSTYPGTPTTPLALGSGISNCLGTKGFNSYGTTPCTTEPYLSYIERAPQINAQDDYLYTPLDASGSACSNQSGCPDYSIQFFLETGASGLKKGLHLLRPNGIQ